MCVLCRMTITEKLRDEMRGRFPPQRGKSKARLSGRIGEEIVIRTDRYVRNSSERIANETVKISGPRLGACRVERSQQMYMHC
eukprot:2780192-Amphidinium_carterae.2